MLELIDPALANANASAAQRADTGAIASLVARAAERAGWRLQWEPGRVRMEAVDLAPPR
jgi:hypothetical protein